MEIIDEKTQRDSQISDSDSSYLTGSGKTASLDLGGLFSNAFSNIKPLYESRIGTTQLYTATRYGKRFVLKGLKEEYRNDPIFNLAMAKEFEIGIGLEHPNIRRTISLEKADGIGQAIVLEYIDGRPLETMLKEKTMSISQGRAICRQIADALGYLHSHQSLHRDLKPANILVTFNGDTVKLIDFNLADNEDFIILKNPAGSGRYMAPELLEPGAAPTPEADIYSLGVVAGEIAEATVDRILQAAAEKCRSKIPSKRIEGFKMLKEGSMRKSPKILLDQFLSSKWLTYLLATICTLLTAIIITKLFTP